MKILITGIPGTGKTTTGNHLQDKYGFVHYDVESIQTLEGIENLQGENIVITWGFAPDGRDNLPIRNLQNLGYRMIWFDGDRVSARKAFNKRGDVPENLLDQQMERIDKMDINSFDPIIINTFDTKGNFLNKDDIIKKIIQEVG